jgi:O-acetyl-ADP-ribose deacetylase (regulator of RNase III)
MIEESSGNLLLADAEALVNTVNCAGYMGKGIALQFRQAHPENFRFYERACRNEEVQPGRMLIFDAGQMFKPRYIINFPTKRHWRGNSRIEDIVSGLDALVRDVRRLGIRSIAVPPLGCGHGGLNWSEVRPLIVRAFEVVPDVKVFLFSPAGAPDAKTMPVRTTKPNMTPARALLVKLMQQYLVLAYRLTQLEIQKLAYFLQAAGEPMQLKYSAGRFGPYATNLSKVLERIEGHFIRGYGDDPKPDREIDLLPDAPKEADKTLSSLPESVERLRTVGELIEGFETPYGMELLSSVHWVAVHGEPVARDAESAIRAVQEWTNRKHRMFKPQHIRVAWDRLVDKGWIVAAGPNPQSAALA